MNNKTKLLFLSILLLLVASSALFLARAGQSVAAETAPLPKGTHLTATGQGVVRIDPDLAYVTGGVTTIRDTAEEAAAETNASMQTLVDAVKALGVEDPDIVTANYTIYPSYDYSGKTAVIVGYQASNSVTVTVRNIEQVAAVIDVMVASGSNDISQVRFDREDKSEAYALALTLAVQNAQAKVETMFAAAGLEGELRPRQIDEQSGSYAPLAMPVALRDESLAGGAVIQTAELEIQAEVRVDFAVGDE